MTVSTAEAHAVNTVIAYLTGRHGYDQSGPPIPSLGQAVDALVALADSADRRLHVGYNAQKATDALSEPWAPQVERDRLRGHPDAARAADDPDAHSCGFPTPTTTQDDRQ